MDGLLESPWKDTSEHIGDFDSVAICHIVRISATQDRTFTGEIMDSQCASMGTHDSIMKQENAKDARMCTQKCVQVGGQYVLYDVTSKSTFQLDDQQKPGDYAGKKVTVTGSYDATAKMIHVEKLQPGS